MYRLPLQSILGQTLGVSSWHLGNLEDGVLQTALILSPNRIVAPADAIVIPDSGGRSSLSDFLRSDPHMSPAFRENKSASLPYGTPRFGVTFKKMPRYLIHVPVSHEDLVSGSLHNMTKEALELSLRLTIPRVAFYVPEETEAPEDAAIAILEQIHGYQTEAFYPNEAILLISGMDLYPGILTRFRDLFTPSPNEPLRGADLEDALKERRLGLREMEETFEREGLAFRAGEIEEFERGLKTFLPDFDPEEEIALKYARITRENVIGQIMRNGMKHYLHFHPSIRRDAGQRIGVFGIATLVRNDSDYIRLVRTIFASLNEYFCQTHPIPEENSVVKDKGNPYAYESRGKGGKRWDIVYGDFPFRSYLPSCLGDQWVRIYAHQGLEEGESSENLLRMLVELHDLKFFEVTGE